MTKQTPPKKRHIRNAVRCIETGVVFKGAAHAAAAIGRTRCAMSNHLAGRAPHLKGFHFEYVTKSMG